MDLVRTYAVRVFAAATASLLCGSAAASADFAAVGQFGAAGSVDGQLTRPKDVAVEPGSGNVFVVDSGNHRVEVFGPNGDSADLLAVFGTTDLVDPAGIAIDVDGGQTTVYVGDAGSGRIVQFESDEAPRPSFAVDAGYRSPAQGTGAGEIGSFAGALAVDARTHELLIADPGADGSDQDVVARYTAGGTFVNAIDGSTALDGAFTGLLDVAVAPDGDVVVVDSATGSIGDVINGAVTRVIRFSAAGGYVTTYGPIGGGAGAVAVEPTDGRVVVAGNLQTWNNSQPLRIDVFAANGSPLPSSTLPSATLWSQVPGLAFDGDGSHRLYAVTDVDPFGQNYGLVSVQALDELEPPEATIAPSTGVGAFSATLHGTVNPHGDPTAARFEYSTDGVSWIPAAPEDVGDGTGDVAVQTTIEALADDTDYQVRLVATKAGGAVTATSATSSFRTLDADAPTVTVAVATDVSPSGATLHGTVDPEGNPTNARFEFSVDDGASWRETPLQDVGDGTAPVPLAAAVNGIAPNTAVRVRVIAFNGAGSSASSEESFSTTAVAPVVETVGTTERGATTAVLRARVNPQHAQTSYRFEYGTDAQYGSSAPASGGLDAGAGTTLRQVSVKLTGLAPSTTYHYRVVATNQVGSAVGDDLSVTTLSSDPAGPRQADQITPGRGFLPDGRGWELVSPTQKNSADIDSGPKLTQSALSGEAVAFHSNGAFAGAVQARNDQTYIATRGSSGWETKSFLPRQDGSAAFAPQTRLQHLSPNLSRAILRAGDPVLTPDAQAHTSNMFLQEIETDAFRLITPSGPAATDSITWNSYAAGFAGASGDYRHIVFESVHPMTPDAPDGANNVYEWVDGEVKLVSVLPNGQPAPNGSYAGPGNPIYGGGVNTGNYTLQAVSRDGARIYFGDAATDQLYLRENGTTTIQVSRSQRTDCAGDPSCGGDGVADPAPDPDGPQAARFRAATPDGGIVYFTTRERLTNDAHGTSNFSGGGDLYRYDVATGRLICLTAAVDGGSESTLGVAGISTDGGTVYFVSSAALVDGAVDGRPNLYLWHNGGMRYLATFGDSAPERRNWESNLFAGGNPSLARVTEDGRYLLVSSDNQLTDDDTGGHRALYRYDRDARVLTCVSCGDAGATADADESFEKGFYYGDLALQRNMSADGQRVFFNTAQALVPQDGNGVSDVYVWQDGRARLLSSGRSSRSAYFADATPSGDDAFFTTAESLVAADGDGNVDLYDARVDGGFPESRTAAPCSGDDCQGAPRAPPSLPSPVTVPGGGDVDDPAPRARPVIRLGRSRVRGTTATIAVRVPARGTIRVSGRGVATVRRAVTRAATYRVSVRLGRAARRTLRRRGRLRVTLVVSYQRAGGGSTTARTTTTFKARR